VRQLFLFHYFQVHKGSNLCTVTGSTFTSNTASDGGGAIFNNQTTNVKPLTITNCIFNGNSAINAGGAIENDNTAVLNVNNSNFTGNKATAINGFGGGAIYNGDGSSLTPTSSIFINDASPYGGAIENYYGTITLQYNQIAGNTLGNEGTIYNNGGSGYASPNWWGQNSGPITGDIVGQGITVTNWLVLKLSANPTTIGNYAHSNIMADLRYDNYGNYVSGGVVPNGIPVTFTTNLGTISQASTVNGVATATLTSGVPTGLATISANLDNQPSYTSVTIKAIPPKVLKTSPTNKKTGFSRTSTIYIKFSENIKFSSYYKNIKVKNLTTGKYVSIHKSISGTDLKIKTSSTRRGHNWYEIIIPKAAIKDMAGNKLAATYTFKFKTKS
jgi:predicted outer membrane repeat protein